MIGLAEPMIGTEERTTTLKGKGKGKGNYNHLKREPSWL